jgi:lipoprotein-releasing system permease protein
LQHADVIAVAPNIQEQGLLVHGNNARGALVHGILPAHEKTVNDINQHMISGSLGALEAGSYRVLLGEQLADKLGVERGDNVMLIAPKGRLTAAGFLPRLRRFEVVGVFDSGVHQFDSVLAYIHLQDAQKVYQFKKSVASLRLKLSDITIAPRVRRELSNTVSDVSLYDWTTSHGSLFRALALEKRIMFIVLTLIVMVAAFNIVSALVTMVRNKRSEIAILRAMGATCGNITRIFLMQGIFIGGGGVLLGLACGLPLASNIGTVVAWLEKQLGFSLFPGDVYQLGKVPSDIVVSDVLVVAVMTFTISLLAAAWPAWRSGRLPPAESLRHE